MPKGGGRHCGGGGGGGGFAGKERNKEKDQRIISRKKKLHGGEGSKGFAQRMHLFSSKISQQIPPNLVLFSPPHLSNKIFLTMSILRLSFSQDDRYNSAFFSSIQMYTREDEKKKE